MSDADEDQAMAQGASPLPLEATALVERLRDLLHGLEDPDEDLLADELARPEREAPLLVVAGETSRGKSTVINALLDAPGLLPTDPDVTTSCQVRIEYGEPAAEVILLDDDGQLANRDIPLADIGRYGSMAGDAAASERVQGINARVEATLLAGGLVVVDTPGFGGLAFGHTAITLAQLRTADAVLFVADTSGPLSRGERAFLAEAADRVATVIVAVNKADMAGDLEASLADVRAALTATDPRLAHAKLLPVSGRLALDGRAEGGEVGEVLVAESGIDELAALIDSQVVDRADAVRAANRCRLVESVSRSVRERLEPRMAALAGDPDAVRELEAAGRDIQALLANEAAWRRRSGLLMSRLSRQLDESLVHRLNAARRDALQFIDDQGPTIYEELPGRLVDQVKSIWSELVVEMLQGYDALVRELLDGLAIDGLRIEPREVYRYRGLGELERTDGDRPGAVGQSAILLSETIGSLGGGLSIWSLGSHLAPTMFVGAPPIWLITGMMSVGLYAFQHRKKTAEQVRQRSDGQRFVKEVLDEAGGDMRRALTDAVQETNAALVNQLNGAIARKHAELLATVEECKVAAASARSEQQDLASRLADAHREIDAMASRAARLATAIDPVVSAPRAAATASSETGTSDREPAAPFVSAPIEGIGSEWFDE